MAGGPRKRQFANQDDAVEAASIPDGDKQAQLCSDWKLQIKLADERNK